MSSSPALDADLDSIFFLFFSGYFGLFSPLCRVQIIICKLKLTSSQKRKIYMRLIIRFVAVLCILGSNVSADPIFLSHVAGTFDRSSHEPKFKIEFHTEESPYHPDDDQESVVVANEDGTNFV